MRFQNSKFFLPIIHFLAGLYVVAAYGFPFLKYYSFIDWSWWWVSLPWWGGMIAAVVIFYLKADRFQPELEQGLSASWKKFKAPQYVAHHTRWDGIDNHNPGPTPFMNNGGEVETGAFRCEAYSWDDNYDQPYNFKWKDLEISWYKHCQRGVSMSRKVSKSECARMLKECLKSLEEK